MLQGDYSGFSAWSSVTRPCDGDLAPVPPVTGTVPCSLDGRRHSHSPLGGLPPSPHGRSSRSEVSPPSSHHGTPTPPVRPTGASGREGSRHVQGGLCSRSRGPACLREDPQKTETSAPLEEVAGLSGSLTRPGRKGQVRKMRSLVLGTEAQRVPGAILPHPRKRKSRRSGFPKNHTASPHENTVSPLATLHVIHQQGQRPLSSIQFELWAPRQEEGGSSLPRPLPLQGSHFLSFPACLLGLPARKGIFYSFLVYFCHRPFIISKAFAYLFFLFRRQTLLITIKMNDSKKKKK